MSPRAECMAFGAALVIAGCGSRPSNGARRCVTATFVMPFSFNVASGPARIAYASVDLPLGDHFDMFDGHVGADDLDCHVGVAFEAEGDRYPYLKDSIAHTFNRNDPCAQVARENYQKLWDDLPVTEVFRRGTEDSVIALCVDSHVPPQPWISGGIQFGSDSIGCIATFLGQWVHSGEEPPPPPPRNYADALRLCSSVHIITEVPEYRRPLPDLNGSGALDVKATAEPTGR